MQRLSITSCLSVAFAGAFTLLPASAQAPHPRAALDPIFAGQDRAGRVHHGTGDAGEPWALGDRWKASFGPAGLHYVPFLGAEAPRNFPFSLELLHVRVGGEELAFARDVAAQRGGDRLTYRRGAVQEIYDLAPGEIEQSFVIDDDRPGDVEVILGVRSELLDDAAVPGLRFENELGGVDYGAAFLVRDGERLSIETEHVDGRIRLRVPAELRGAGPVVIDPVIGSFQNSGRPGQGDDTLPDVAYDATSGTFVVVWTTMFSQTDADVWMEVLSESGYPLSGAARALDLSSTFFTTPRIANANAADRFLVVMERRQTTSSDIVGVLVPASSYLPGPFFVINASGGSHSSPDIGGDPRPNAAGSFCVTWVTSVTGGSEIHARVVQPDGFLLPATPIATRGSYTQVDISQSNDCGSHAPRWLLVYVNVLSSARADLHRAMIGTDGAVLQPSTSLYATGRAYLYPSTSSPVLAPDGRPQWLVTAEEQSPGHAQGLIVSLDPTSSWNEPLGAYHGIGPIRLRAESDGARFAIVSGSTSSGSLVMSAATWAWWQNSGALHESPSQLSGTVAFPRLCSKVSGGGTQGADYLIVGAQQYSGARHRISIARYMGHSAGATMRTRDTDCNDLYLRSSGGAFLGGQLSFALTNQGADLPGFLVGLPLDPAFALCGTCLLGVDLFGPSLGFAGTSRLSLSIPTRVDLLGAGFACQGYAIGSGTCGAPIRLSDTIDFWIR